jgi:hypothetical protein
MGQVATLYALVSPHVGPGVVMKIQDRNRYKVKQFVLYIAKAMEEAKFFGSVKLNKVLYRADHEALRQLGKKITTYNYRKQALGPTLDAYLHVVGEMVLDGQLEMEARPAGTQTEQRPKAKEEPDLAVFTAKEKAIMDSEIQRAWEITARDIIEEEHATAAWYATKMGGVIQSSLFLVENPGTIVSLTDAEEAHAKEALRLYSAGA